MQLQRHPFLKGGDGVQAAGPIGIFRHPSGEYRWTFIGEMGEHDPLERSAHVLDNPQNTIYYDHNVSVFPMITMQAMLKLVLDKVFVPTSIANGTDYQDQQYWQDQRFANYLYLLDAESREEVLVYHMDRLTTLLTLLNDLLVDSKRPVLVLQELDKKEEARRLFSTYKDDLNNEVHLISFIMCRGGRIFRSHKLVCDVEQKYSTVTKSGKTLLEVIKKVIKRQEAIEVVHDENVKQREEDSLDKHILLPIPMADVVSVTCGPRPSPETPKILEEQCTPSYKSPAAPKIMKPILSKQARCASEAKLKAKQKGSLPSKAGGQKFAHQKVNK